jgi:hypothetical protein
MLDAMKKYSPSFNNTKDIVYNANNIIANIATKYNCKKSTQRDCHIAAIFFIGEVVGGFLELDPTHVYDELYDMVAFENTNIVCKQIRAMRRRINYYKNYDKNMLKGLGITATQP